MPNHCENRIRFSSQYKSEISDILGIFETSLSDEGGTVFGKFVPEPKWEVIPNASGELPVNGEFKGGVQDCRWYDWRIANWGTKWDCYNVDFWEVSKSLAKKWGHDTELKETDYYTFGVTFDTAWEPPNHIYYAIAEKYQTVDVSWFYHEPNMELTGYYGVG